MATLGYLQSSFAGGLMGRSLAGRTDLDRYPISCRVLMNMMPEAGGPATARPGTRYIAPTRNNNPARLIGFSFNSEQTYQLEVTGGWIRFCRDGAQIESGGSPYEIAAPWAEADLQKLRWAQSADQLIVCCEGYAPRVISRASDTSWSIATLPFEDGPYLEVNTTATTLTATGTLTAGGTVTITASAALFAAGDVGRLIRIRRSTNLNNWGWVTITAYTSATEVTATVGSALDASLAATPSTVWRLGAWGSVPGWPEAVTYSGGRLWLAATTAQPQTKFSSRSGAFDQFSPSDPDGTVADDHALVLTLDDDRVNKIEWMLDQQGALLVGTSGGEFVVRARSSVEAITPTNLGAFRQSTHGSATGASAVKVGPAVLFVERGAGSDPVLPGNGAGGGRAVRELVFSFEVDQYMASDLTRIAPEVARAVPLADQAVLRFDAAGSGGIVDLAVQQTPGPIVWGLRADGVLLSLLYDREQRLAAWASHVLGGSCPDSIGRQAGSDLDPAGASSHAAGRVESISAIRENASAQDQLYMVVKREIDGSTVRYIEILSPPFELRGRVDEAVFLDSSLAYHGWNTDATLTLTPTDAGDGLYTLTASATLFTDPDDVGRVIAIRTAANARGLDEAYATLLKITAVSSATVATAEPWAPAGGMPEADAQIADLLGSATALWGWATLTISGLDHLEGETVELLADGAVAGSAVVESGAAALDRPAAVVQAGLGYRSVLEPMPIAVASTRMDGRGRTLDVKRVIVQVLRSGLSAAVRSVMLGTRGNEAGADADAMALRDSEDITGAAPGLIDGRVAVMASSGAARDLTLRMTREGPLPLSVLEISAEVGAE
jgi:hypothetical protein